MTKTSRPSKARTPVEGSLSDAVSTFYTTCQELRDEMQEAYDNTPESLQSSGVGEARGEAASALDGFCDDEPEIPEGAESLSCSWTENRLRKASRADRRDSAVNAADAAISLIEERIAQLEQLISDAEATEDETETEQEQRDALDELRERLENDKAEAEAVEFPGMYG